MNRLPTIVAMLCFVGLVLSTGPATATCYIDEQGYTTCCPPGGPCTTTKPDPVERTFDDASERSPWRWMASAGPSIAVDAGSALVAPGGILRLGLHRLGEFRSATLDGDEREATVWCAPVLCGLAGIAVVPWSGFVGNEWGVDPGVAIYATDGRTTIDLSVDLVATVARESRWQTSSFLGLLLPEVAVELGEATSPRIGWQIYPIAVRFGRWAVAWDGATVGVAWRDTAALDLRTSLTLRFSP